MHVCTTDCASRHSTARVCRTTAVIVARDRAQCVPAQCRDPTTRARPMGATDVAARSTTFGLSLDGQRAAADHRVWGPHAMLLPPSCSTPQVSPRFPVVGSVDFGGASWVGSNYRVTANKSFASSEGAGRLCVGGSCAPANALHNVRARLAAGGSACALKLSHAN